MGLAERRVTKQFQDSQFPALRDEIHKAAGFPVPIEVNWEQIAVDGRTDYYADYWTKVFFTPVTDALKQIGADDMGKEALQGGLKKIEFRNSAQGNSSPRSAIKFENGALVIDHSMSNVDDVKDRTKYLVEVIEKSL